MMIDDDDNGAADGCNLFLQRLSACFRHLHLNRMQITGSIPSTIGNLSSLRYVTSCVLVWCLYAWSGILMILDVRCPDVAMSIGDDDAIWFCWRICIILVIVIHSLILMHVHDGIDCCSWQWLWCWSTTMMHVDNEETFRWWLLCMFIIVISIDNCGAS